ncbi:hypothetical protein E2P81_ATG02491 [Venturia nashicola]|uniref:Uncharacterized protein n=1 Tax=Venturia nashicola TaxID=86259 RepID=A0A4Z1PP48_9PEZI|nr:hypothetical protein E6O75_ATG02549 [Venturia nashicola]TLD36709.1 hypothetical protein E2P81_ATG02491 [Venturia nashicola]
MSSKLMDTEVGGEQTQYESIQTVTKPHSKESGQLGGISSSSTPPSPEPSNQTDFVATSENTSTPSTDSADPVSKERGEKTAENVRYGQAISEQGVGGFTAPGLNGGSAMQEGGSARQEEDTGRMRREQGYGGDEEMSKTVGG